MYDPKIARFLQEDTYLGDSKDPLSLNLYTYCFNNPIKYDDPTGHDPNKMSYHIYEQKLGSKNNFIQGYYPTAAVSTRGLVSTPTTNKKKAKNNDDDLEPVKTTIYLFEEWYDNDENKDKVPAIIIIPGTVDEFWEASASMNPGAAGAELGKSITIGWNGLKKAFHSSKTGIPKLISFFKNIGKGRPLVDDGVRVIDDLSKSSPSAKKVIGEVAETVGENGDNLVAPSTATSNNGTIGAPLSIHPGKLAAESSEVSYESVMRALRQSGSVEGAATAKLLKKGKVNLKVLDDVDAYKALYKDKNFYSQNTVALQPYYSNDVIVFKNNMPNVMKAAGGTAHETRHWLQKLTPWKYNRNKLLYESEAYEWSVAVDKSMNMRIDEIPGFVKAYYGIE